MSALDLATRSLGRAGGHRFSVPATLVAMGGAALAGGIHLAVVPAHLREAWPLGVFFLVLGLAQLVLVPLLARGLSPTLLLGVLTAHLMVIALYVASRTTDLPFVPPHDVGHEIGHLPVEGGVGNGIPVYPGSRTEEVGFLDLVCLAAELALVVAVVSLLPARLREPVATVVAGLAVLGLVLRGLSLMAG